MPVVQAPYAFTAALNAKHDGNEHTASFERSTYRHNMGRHAIRRHEANGRTVPDESPGTIIALMVGLSFAIWSGVLLALAT